MEEFAERIVPTITDWLKALTKNASTGQQALRKMLLEKITATRNEDGTWTLNIRQDFIALLAETGVLTMRMWPWCKKSN